MLTMNISSNGSRDSGKNRQQNWDAVETYFECITTCSLDDGECITRCVEELREALLRCLYLQDRRQRVALLLRRSPSGEALREHR